MPLNSPQSWWQQPPNHYAILGLAPPSTTSTASNPTQIVTTSQIKAAYRQALLKHHPDKSQVSASHSSPQHRPGPTFWTQNPASRPPPNRTFIPSIDSITAARDVLINPQSRRDYDRQLLRQSLASIHQGVVEHLLPDRVISTDTIDLDDMTYVSENNVWRLDCRCGDEIGYELSESDLLDSVDLWTNEEHGSRAGDGEVLVECAGCSLVVRVLFHALGDRQSSTFEEAPDSNGTENEYGSVGGVL